MYRSMNTNVAHTGTRHNFDLFVIVSAWRVSGRHQATLLSGDRVFTL